MSILHIKRFRLTRRAIFQPDEELQRQTKRVAGREFVLLKTIPGIGESLGLTILYEIGLIDRFPSVKDFLSYCRLVKGTVASGSVHSMVGCEYLGLMNR